MRERQSTESDGLNGPMSRGRHLLDEVYRHIQRDPLSVSHAMSKLLDGLHKVRRALPRDDWQRFCHKVASSHELARLVYQDPFTLHSARKPRGYAGDAELLDYIYGHRQASSTPLGQSIFAFTTNTPVSRAVRTRARIIAGIIDRLAAERGPLRILSIACGHLREADLSAAVHEGRVAEYVAFDQDVASLSLVSRRLGDRNVRTVHGSIADLLMGRHKDLAEFDFVYAAGLYDYLSQRLATRMTTWMFNATRPTGLTLLTNYARDIVGDGYMEAFMQWELIFRTPEELMDTASRIAPDQIANVRTYHEDDGMVIFVELRKASRVRVAADTASRPTRTLVHGGRTVTRTG